VEVTGIRTGLHLALGVVVVMTTGCGPASTAITARAGVGSTSTSTVTGATGVLQLGDADNGGSTTVPVGHRVIVTLASTYWAIADASDQRVLGRDTQPVALPGGPSCPTIGGSRCGRVVAAFSALAPGVADLGADRSSCGEALRCSESQAHWRFHVRVVSTATTTQPVSATTTIAVARTTVPASGATSSTGQLRSVVCGTVVFGPICPVERVPPDPQCAPRPGAAEIHLVRVGDGTTLSGQAGADGRFSIAAGPGTYAVKAVTNASPGRGCSADPSQVTVVPGAGASVSVSCDTGIR